MYFIYTLWLKRTSVKILSSEERLKRHPWLAGRQPGDGYRKCIRFGQPLPWLMFSLIFLWIPPILGTCIVATNTRRQGLHDARFDRRTLTEKFCTDHGGIAAMLAQPMIWVNYLTYLYTLIVLLLDIGTMIVLQSMSINL